MIRISWVLGVAMMLVGAGCGDSGDCASMCKDAQSKSCTAIKGDCDAFCSALDVVAPPSNCSDKKSAYLDCLGSSSHPCDSNCTGQENALASCIGIYCLTHATDKDCQTLKASF